MGTKGQVEQTIDQLKNLGGKVRECVALEKAGMEKLSMRRAGACAEKTPEGKKPLS